MAALSMSLLDSSRMGLIMLDPDCKIDVCHGKLVSWLPVGSQATEVMPILTGLDDVLADIENGRRSSFTLPRVGWDGVDFGDKILSLEIMRSDMPGRLQILVRDETEIAGLEQDVLQQRNKLALANEALAKAKERAEAALQEKASFLANISHDLKTPLQVIMGNAEILRGDLPETEREEFLQDVLDNSRFLLALITDLLEASALEADQLELTEEPVNVRELLQRILSMAEQIPESGDRRLELHMDETDCVVIADPMRLQRLLLNLVTNAVKFTDEGGLVMVSAGRADAGDFVIQVEDDGCGIEPEMQDRVFEPFTTSGSAEGSGLGLHIAKGVAELHDAELRLSSVPGDGTTVRLCLPKSRVIDRSA